MTPGNSRHDDEAKVRAVIDDWAKAIAAKDIDAVMSHYAADLRCKLQAQMFRGPIGYEIRDLYITTGDDVAFCRSLNRISGTRTDGEETDVWVRATVGLRKISGKWLIVHAHEPVPFYMDGSYRAAVDLKP